MPTGKEIRDARKRAGMSQGALAKEVGVSLRTVGGWERDENIPNIAEPRLLEVLGPYMGQEKTLSEADTGRFLTTVTAEDLDPRLNNIERQIDALWRRLGELGGDARAEGLEGDHVATFPGSGKTQGLQDGIPPIPEDVAADDPAEVSEYVKQQTAEHGDDNQGR